VLLNPLSCNRPPLPDALALSVVCLLIAGSMGLPLIRMDSDDHFRCRYPDDYCRCRHDVIFSMFSIFPVIVIFSAALTARKNAAGSCEQGGNAYHQKDGFHICSYLVISSEDSSSVVINPL
jgi:hypothetical protein